MRSGLVPGHRQLGRWVAHMRTTIVRCGSWRGCWWHPRSYQYMPRAKELGTLSLWFGAAKPNKGGSSKCLQFYVITQSGSWRSGEATQVLCLEVIVSIRKESWFSHTTKNTPVFSQVEDENNGQCPPLQKYLVDASGGSGSCDGWVKACHCLSNMRFFIIIIFVWKSNSPKGAGLCKASRRYIPL